MAIRSVEDVSSPSWLLCRAGTSFCALPLARVIEILRVLPIEALSGMPRFVCGVSILRGAPVAVIDVALLLGGRGGKAERLVAVRTGPRTIALLVDSVIGVRAFGGDSCHDLPPLVRETASEAIAAIGTYDAELLLLLNAARIVPQALLDGLGAAAVPS